MTTNAGRDLHLLHRDDFSSMVEMSTLTPHDDVLIKLTGSQGFQLFDKYGRFLPLAFESPEVKDILSQTSLEFNQEDKNESDFLFHPIKNKYRILQVQIIDVNQ